jgi:dethiobiotin synthetase
MTVLFVAGTDTGVGKTAVTAALAAVARIQGATVAVVKPAQTGLDATEAGDLDEIRRLSGVEDVHELARYPEPLAPASAARRAGRQGVGAATVAEAVGGLTGRDLILVEGAGGLLVRFDGEGATLADAAALLGAPVLVVTRAGLGALNHAALTCEALGTRGLDCPGLVIGAWPAAPDLAAWCNLDDLPAYTGRPILGRIPEGAPALEPAVFANRAQNWISTEGLL